MFSRFMVEPRRVKSIDTLRFQSTVSIYFKALTWWVPLDLKMAFNSAPPAELSSSSNWNSHRSISTDSQYRSGTFSELKNSGGKWGLLGDVLLYDMSCRMGLLYDVLLDGTCLVLRRGSNTEYEDLTGLRRLVLGILKDEVWLKDQVLTRLRTFTACEKARFINKKASMGSIRHFTNF